MLGETVRVIVDRPLGSTHPKWKDLRYPVNYGYVEGVLAPDGEEQDVYILGVEVPLEEFVGQVIAVIHRLTTWRRNGWPRRRGSAFPGRRSLPGWRSRSAGSERRSECSESPCGRKSAGAFSVVPVPGGRPDA